MDVFWSVIFSAIVVEGIITYIKLLIVDRQIQWQVIAGIGIGIIVAVGFNVDLFALVGMVSTIPFLGDILTGILLSRGANYIFDLIGKITVKGV